MFLHGRLDLTVNYGHQSRFQHNIDFSHIYLPLAEIMPGKERIKKEKQKQLQQSARGSSSLLSWIKPSSSKANEDPETEHVSHDEPIISDDDGEEERSVNHVKGFNPPNTLFPLLMLWIP